MAEIIIRTLLPIILLILLGYLSKAFKIFKKEDDRSFSSYVYYFALPALLFVNIAETEFNQSTLNFMIACALPTMIIAAFYLLLFLIFRFKKELLYLLIFCTAFGSTAFFGIPFIMFAFPTLVAEKLAVLSVAAIAIPGVILTVLVLELYKMGRISFLGGIKRLISVFYKNPLIISIFAGFIMALLKVRMFSPLSQTLHMLGGTTATVALFMLGMVMFGKRLESVPAAFVLSLLRIIILPLVALAACVYFNLNGPEKNIALLMNAMPVAVSMIVFSERYDFYKGLIATLTIISSVLSVIYLPVWLIILGIK
ncbi:MAG: AEC family transporter [Candidatus Saganbacteria bacterium]|nr:AEC family transporter [Candidatus Saganbacteria bacterium]